MFSGFSRRQLLRLTSLLVAGIAVGSLPFLKKFFITKAQAQVSSNIESQSQSTATGEGQSQSQGQVVAEEVYKNRRYKIVKNINDATPQTLQEGNQTIATPYEAPFEIWIDDQKISAIRDKETQMYQTYLLPFTEYNSPRELAKHLIDLGVKVPSGKAKLNYNIR